MAVSRIGGWSSSTGLSTLTHSNGAGSNRIMIVAAGSEGGASATLDSIDYGGQAMIKAVGTQTGGGTKARSDIWYLLEAGIAAASTTTITTTYGAAPAAESIAAATYGGVDQTGGATTIPETNSDFTNGSTPNPIVDFDITEATDNAVVGNASSGDSGTTTWHADMSEVVDQIDASYTQSVSDRLSTTDAAIQIEPTFTVQNRAAGTSIEIAAVASTFKLEGDTRDFAGATLATCRCVLLKRTNVAEATRVYSIIDHVNSNGSGLYSFTGIVDDDALYMVMSFDIATPIVRGVTNDTLKPVTE